MNIKDLKCPKCDHPILNAEDIIRDYQKFALEDLKRKVDNEIRQMAKRISKG